MTQDEWRTRVDTSLTEITRRLVIVETKNAVDEVHRTNVENRLSSIEDTLKWLVRLIMGAIVLAVIGYAVGGGFAVV